MVCRIRKPHNIQPGKVQKRDNRKYCIYVQQKDLDVNGSDSG